jgi:Predicted membrane protein (DUF2306)
MPRTKVIDAASGSPSYTEGRHRPQESVATEAGTIPIPGRAARNAGMAESTLERAAKFWFGMTVFGQSLFFVFIVAFYYPSTLSGRFSVWNSKPIITGFQVGDLAGNLMFAAHVLLAALITGAGLVQLLHPIRSRWPAVHRWNGRVYLITAVLLALGGLWMVWSRGAYMNLAGAIGISLDALLIFGCAAMAWRHAHQRRFDLHRRWALRTFVVASAVWFMRVGYMAWAIATGGPGIGEKMDGPFDLFIAFANSLLPLAILEIFLRVQDRGSKGERFAMAGLLVACGVVIAVGSVGAWLMMWGPYI